MPCRALTLSLAFIAAIAAVPAGCGDPPCPPGSTRTAEGRCIGDRDAGDAGDTGDAGDASRDTGADSAIRDTGAAEDTGLEDSCTVTGPDLPDPAFIDSDCDGIDGDREASVFVATTGDDGHDGTRPDRAVQTIGRGIAIAATLGRPSVLIAAGTYVEQLTLADGVSLYGGYDAAAGWGRTGAVTALEGPAPVVTGIDVGGVTLAGLDVRATASAAGASNFAARFVRATEITLRGVRFEGGDGGPGGHGPAVTTTANSGRLGSLGGPGVYSGSSCPSATSASPPALGTGGSVAASCSCAAGGGGGRAGHFWDSAGGFSTTAGSGGPGAPVDRALYLGSLACPAFVGPAGGTPGTTGLRTGRNGTGGSNGADGDPGARAVAMGTFTAAGYTTAGGGDGIAGVGGYGGGGGGGGLGCVIDSFCYVSGGSGGGGGSGGCGGAPGRGGSGGGAAVALFLWDSSVALEGATLTPGTGGAGGAGSAGRPGAPGATGRVGGAALAAPGCTSGAGGTGGQGGDGGDGGAGAGGAGGPAFGVVAGGTSAITPDGATVINAGAGGAGGSGGPGAPDGPTGTSAATYEP